MIERRYTYGKDKNDSTVSGNSPDCACVYITGVCRRSFAYHTSSIPVACRRIFFKTHDHLTFHSVILRHATLPLPETEHPDWLYASTTNGSYTRQVVHRRFAEHIVAIKLTYSIPVACRRTFFRTHDHLTFHTTILRHATLPLSARSVQRQPAFRHRSCRV